MSPSEVLLTRLINLGCREFVSKEACYPEYSLTIASLRSSFKRFVTKEAVEITRKETVNGHEVYYYRVNRYRLRQYMDSFRTYSKRSFTTHSYGWENIWPEFFVDPKFKGRKRTITHAEA